MTSLNRVVTLHDPEGRTLFAWSGWTKRYRDAPPLARRDALAAWRMARSAGRKAPKRAALLAAEARQGRASPYGLGSWLLARLEVKNAKAPPQERLDAMVRAIALSDPALRAAYSRDCSVEVMLSHDDLHGLAALAYVVDPQGDDTSPDGDTEAALMLLAVWMQARGAKITGNHGAYVHIRENAPRSATLAAALQYGPLPEALRAGLHDACAALRKGGAKALAERIQARDPDDGPRRER